MWFKSDLAIAFKNIFRETIFENLTLYAISCLKTHGWSKYYDSGTYWVEWESFTPLSA